MQLAGLLITLAGLLVMPFHELVNRALRTLGVEPAGALLIGDSVTDIEVCRLVGVRSVGYAKSSERGQELEQAGAEAVINSMSVVADLARQLTP